MKRLLKKLIGRRARKFYLWSGVCLVTLIVMAYQIANWRGASAWKKAQERLENEGEKFTFADLVPERVPEAENFFATPALFDIAKIDAKGTDSGPHAEMRRRLKDLNPTRKADGVNAKPPPNNDPSTATPMDFAAWTEYAEAAGTLDLAGAEGSSPAARFLAALDRAHGPLFEELVAAASRQHSVITPSLDQLAEGKRLYEIEIPHYSAIQGLAAILTLRASAAAQSGDMKRAEESIGALLKLANGCRSDPILIGLLVSMSFDERCHRAIWEMIHARTFDAASLERLQRQLAAIDVRSAFLNTIRGELVGILEATDWVAEDGSTASMILNDGEPSGAASMAVSLIPSGWLDQNRSYMVNWYLDYVILPTRDGGLSEALVKGAALEQMMREERGRALFHPHKLLPLISMPVIHSVVRKIVYGEAQRRLVVLACALERYKLDQGSYPETLDALVPATIDAIPADPCSPTGDGLRYQIDGDRYQIWSIALDREDDGGTVEEDARKRTRENYAGDWSWQFVE